MQRVLTDNQVREIRRLHKAGMSLQRIANREHVSFSTIRSICRRSTYADVIDLVNDKPDPTSLLENLLKYGESTRVSVSVIEDDDNGR